MSVKLTNISHGAPNWEDALNNNFSKINVDSGDIALPMLAPATGNLGFESSSKRQRSR